MATITAENKTADAKAAEINSKDSKAADPKAAGAKGKKLKKIIPIVIAVVVIIALSLSYYFLVYTKSFIETDNAKVTAKMYMLYPSVGGTLLQWDVSEGSYVNKDQILGRTQSLPYISSPIKGTVVQNNVRENQSVGVSTLLAVVADTDNLYIGVNIKETEISKLSIGQKADVKIDAYPGVKFEGTVTEIGSTTQTYFSNMSSFTTSGTYTKVTQYIPVKVEIKNPDNRLLIYGMNSTVRLLVK